MLALVALLHIEKHREEEKLHSGNQHECVQNRLRSGDSSTDDLFDRSFEIGSVIVYYGHGVDVWEVNALIQAPHVNHNFNLVRSDI